MSRVYECDICKRQYRSISDMQCYSGIFYDMHTSNGEEGEAHPVVDEAFDMCIECASAVYGAIAEIREAFANETT